MAETPTATIAPAQGTTEEKPPVEMINLTVDGKPVSVPKGTLVITAAFQAGADVPYFCHHPRLRPVGACRMCLVSVAKMPGLQTWPARRRCMEGMAVDTVSPEAKQAQNGILEFLLIESPAGLPDL